MTIVVLLVVVAVVGAIVIVLAGRNGQQAEFAPDRPAFVLPEEPITGPDVDAVRFAVGVRGYRMDQVDEVMDRLSAELSDRDRQLAELRGEPVPVVGEPFVADAASASAAATANAEEVDFASAGAVDASDAAADSDSDRD